MFSTNTFAGCRYSGYRPRANLSEGFSLILSGFYGSIAAR